jgi:hypothetical protein
MAVSSAATGAPRLLTRTRGRNIEFGQLTGKKQVSGEFRDEPLKLCTCTGASRLI